VAPKPQRPLTLGMELGRKPESGLGMELGRKFESGLCMELGRKFESGLHAERRARTNRSPRRRLHDIGLCLTVHRGRGDHDWEAAVALEERAPHVHVPLICQERLAEK